MINSRPITPERRRLLAKVHVAVKKLGMEEDDYRGLLARVTGLGSARECSDPQLEELLREFKRMGFIPSVRTGRLPLADHAIAKKARALWISLHALGVVHDPSERALAAFGKRQLGVDRLQWADQSQGYRLIEALKAIAERHGWDQRLPDGVTGPEAGRVLRERLLKALCRRAANLGISFSQDAMRPLDDDQLDAAIVELGAACRSANKTGGAK